MATGYQVVLDDDLYLEYHAYKNSTDGKGFSKDIVSKILRFSGNAVLSNLAQFERLGLIGDADTTLAIALRKDTQNKRKNLEELAQNTSCKIILTNDSAKTVYPYVNINDDEIEMVMGGFIMRGTSRAKGIAHIKSLCADAKEVMVYDKYFSEASNLQNNVDTLTSILPTARKIEITYHKDTTLNPPHFTDECITKIQDKAAAWVFYDRKLPEHHDRYLVINNKIEIILTSGFDYMTRTDKELSYIVRQYGNRFA